MVALRQCRRRRRQGPDRVPARAPDAALVAPRPSARTGGCHRCARSGLRLPSPSALRASACVGARLALPWPRAPWRPTLAVGSLSARAPAQAAAHGRGVRALLSAPAPAAVLAARVLGVGRRRRASCAALAARVPTDPVPRGSRHAAGAYRHPPRPAEPYAKCFGSVTLSSCSWWYPPVQSPASATKPLSTWEQAPYLGTKPGHFLLLEFHRNP